MTKAVQGFLPAFSAGLKRSTADPLGMAEFFRRLGSGDVARAYEDPAFGWGAAKTEGQDALGFLFGSPDAAQAVARQAAAFTGLAQDKLQELLPALAAMMLGGFAKQANAANPMFDALLKQFQAMTPDPRGSAKGPLDRYEEEQAERERRAGGDFAGAQTEMMQAGLAAFQAGTTAWQKALGDMTSVMGAPGGSGKPEDAAAGQNIFGDMFEPGMRLGEAYQREMEATVERFRAAGPKAG